MQECRGITSVHTAVLQLVPDPNPGITAKPGWDYNDTPAQAHLSLKDRCTSCPRNKKYQYFFFLIFILQKEPMNDILISGNVYLTINYFQNIILRHKTLPHYSFNMTKKMFCLSLKYFIIGRKWLI